MEIKRQVIINASADKVWNILGPQYDRVAEWVSTVQVSRSHDSGAVLPHAPISGRVCETDLGPFQETITQYDEGERILAYQAQGEKMPFFVKQLSNHWTVTPLNNSQSRVDMRAEISLLPVFGLMMGPIMRMQMGGILTNATEELKYFAEKGVPHPRKLEADRKHQFIAA
ncbi:MAG: SRPBCC family protein [Cyanobacteria bacterium P01_F01_bin.33]